MSRDQSIPEPPPAGWYPDPAGGKDFRWWDGASWTGGARQSVNERWRVWFTTTTAALAVSRVVMVAAGVGMLLAAAVAVLALMQARPLPGRLLLFAPAVPALLVGQLWAIAVMNTRLPGRPFVLRQLAAAAVSSWKSMRRVVLGPLPALAAYLLVALFYCGILAGMTGLPAEDGSPHDGTPGCPYQLIHVGGVNGTTRCVSLTTYQHAAAAEQQSVAGLLVSFFALHFTVAWSEVVRRRQAIRP